MIFSLDIKILDIQYKIITNSFLLKNFIEKGFAFFPHIDNTRYAIKENYILKDPQNNREVYLGHFRLVKKIFENVQKRYWIFHASAFSKNGRGTILIGDSNCGKTLLVFIAGLLGAKVIGDEYILINKRSSKIFPFRFFLKLGRFNEKFLKKIINHNIHSSQESFLKIGNSILVNRDDLNQMGIKVNNDRVPAGDIIILEDKKYDSLLHICKHCFNKEPKADKLLVSLNKFINKRNIRFMPFKSFHLGDYQRILRYVKRRYL